MNFWKPLDFTTIKIWAICAYINYNILNNTRNLLTNIMKAKYAHSFFQSLDMVWSWKVKYFPIDKVH